MTSRNARDDPGQRPVWVPVAAVVVSGLVVNWLSDTISVSAPILIALAAVALFLLVAAERSSRVAVPIVGPNVELAKLALLALLIGAGVGAAAVLPIFNEHVLTGPWGYFHTYELGATCALVTLGVVSAVRRREPVQWLVFLAGSTAGMSLAIVSLKPGNAFVPTFAGWLVVAVVVTTVAANGRDLVRMFGDFLGFRPRERVRTSPAGDDDGGG